MAIQKDATRASTRTRQTGITPKQKKGHGRRTCSHCRSAASGVRAAAVLAPTNHLRVARIARRDKLPCFDVALDPSAVRLCIRGVTAPAASIIHEADWAAGRPKLALSLLRTVPELNTVVIGDSYGVRAGTTAEGGGVAGATDTPRTGDQHGAGTLRRLFFLSQPSSSARSRTSRRTRVYTTPPKGTGATFRARPTRAARPAALGTAGTRTPETSDVDP